MEIFKAKPEERIPFSLKMKMRSNQGRRRTMRWRRFRQHKGWKLSPQLPALPVTPPPRHLCPQNLAAQSCSKPTK